MTENKTGSLKWKCRPQWWVMLGYFLCSKRCTASRAHSREKQKHWRKYCLQTEPNTNKTAHITKTERRQSSQPGLKSLGRETTDNGHNVSGAASQPMNISTTSKPICINQKSKAGESRKSKRVSPQAVKNMHIGASHWQRTSSFVSETDEKWVPAGQAATNLPPCEKQNRI